MTVSGTLQRQVSGALPITSRSLVLFRLGEVCNNRCPMCSNSGRPDAHLIPRGALLARVRRLVEWGVPRVILTGGEPSIHPAYMDVAEALHEAGIPFDLNTHGRSFAGPDLASRSVALGLGRAIVSLHSHVVEVSCVMSGMSPDAHVATLTGIDSLLRHGVEVCLNLVMSRLNADHLAGFVAYCAERFDGRVAVKLCFPYTGGRGGAWSGVQLRFAEVAEPLREARALAERLGLTLFTESVPACVLRDPHARDMGRSGFGETHYLEDLHGEELFTMRAIEAALRVWPASCRGCAALDRCSGVEPRYLERYGGGELEPFDPEAA